MQRVKRERNLLELTGLALMTFHPLGRVLVFSLTEDRVYTVILQGQRLSLN